MQVWYSAVLQYKLSFPGTALLAALPSLKGTRGLLCTCDQWSLCVVTGNAACLGRAAAGILHTGIILDWLQWMCYFPFANTWGLITLTTEKNTLIYMMITLVFSNGIWKHTLLSLPPLSRLHGLKTDDNCSANRMMLSLAARKTFH